MKSIIKFTNRILRSRLFLGLVLLAVLNTSHFAAPVKAEDKPTEVRIGYQRGGVWSYLKQTGDLEKLLGPDIKVTWTLFPAGPQLLEAMNASSIDIGSTGDTPPIFAQAAGTPLVYVLSVAGNGAGEAILVPENSPLKTINDLKGKKVAFTKGSAAHLALVKALRKFNLDYKDIQPVFLAPSEARAAFTGGSIDAWVIWDPFRAAAIKELNAHALIEGQDIASTKAYVEVAKKFLDAYPDTVRTVLQQVQKTNSWARDHKDEYAEAIAKETGIDVSIIKFSFTSDFPDYLWIDDDAIKYQQETADIFYNLGLIPDKLNIKDVVWIGGTNPTPAATESATGEATQAAATESATAAATASK